MKTYLLPLALLLSLTACKKEDLDADGLVPATQEGKDTGDFLVNGEVFHPRSYASSPGSNGVSAFWHLTDHGVRTIDLAFFRVEDNHKTRLLYITLSNIRKPGDYHLLERVTTVVVPGEQSGCVYDAGYKADSSHLELVSGPTAPMRVEVTRYDTIAHIISGRFEGKLREYNGPDSISITKGRFDLTF